MNIENWLLDHQRLRRTLVTLPAWQVAGLLREHARREEHCFSAVSVDAATRASFRHAIEEHQDLEARFTRISGGADFSAEDLDFLDHHFLEEEAALRMSPPRTWPYVPIEELAHLSTLLPVGQRVKVYRNLHKDTWSLMATEGPQKGRVIGYANEVLIGSPTLTVGEASRQRAIREHSRNVHAFVVGTVLEPRRPEEGLTRVRYNPFRAGCFTDPGGQCVVRSGLALLDRQGFLWMDLPDPDFTLLMAQAEARLRAESPGPYLDDFLQRMRPMLEATVRRQLSQETP